MSLGTWSTGTDNLTAQAIGICTAKTKTGITLASQSTDNQGANIYCYYIVIGR
jgi:hypothetical protein